MAAKLQRAGSSWGRGSPGDSERVGRPNDFPKPGSRGFQRPQPNLCRRAWQPQQPSHPQRTGCQGEVEDKTAARVRASRAGAKRFGPAGSVEARLTRGRRVALLSRSSNAVFMIALLHVRARVCMCAVCARGCALALHACAHGGWKFPSLGAHQSKHVRLNVRMCADCALGCAWLLWVCAASVAWRLLWRPSAWSPRECSEWKRSASPSTGAHIHAHILCAHTPHAKRTYTAHIHAHMHSAHTPRTDTSGALMTSAGKII